MFFIKMIRVKYIYNIAIILIPNYIIYCEE